MSATTPLPTAEQQQRAKWDLLLTDLELRQEQIRNLRTHEPTKSALLLADLELRHEQIRQMIKFEPLKLAISALATGVALAGAMAGGTIWLLHTLGYLS
jgi:hypothetical protein